MSNNDEKWKHLPTTNFEKPILFSFFCKLKRKKSFKLKIFNEY